MSEEKGSSGENVKAHFKKFASDCEKLASDVSTDAEKFAAEAKSSAEKHSAEAKVDAEKFKAEAKTDADKLKSDAKQFAAEADTNLDRAKQYTEEKLGQAEKTELDAHFENLLQRADKTRQWTEKILKQTEAVLQPNPTARLEEFCYDKLDKKKRDRITNSDTLGELMIDAGNDFGPGTSYGSALVKCGTTQQKLGQAEKDYLASTTTNFLQPLRAFLDGDMKTVQKERKILETKRLDLDAAKTRLRRAKSQSTKDSDDEAVAAAEADLRVAQAEFDRQAEITKLLLEGISSTHAHHLRCLHDFVEAQQTYYAQCQQYMADLQRQLGSIISEEGANAEQK